MDVPSTQETVQPVFTSPSALVQNDGEDARRTVIVEPPFKRGETPSRQQVKETYSDRDLLYLAIAEQTSELHYPAYMIQYTIKEVMTPGHVQNTDLQLTRSITRRAMLVEGEVLFFWLKWWSIASILLLMPACLISLVMGTSWIPGSDWLTGFVTTNAGLIPICLVVAFSLGLLVQKLGSYGWRRSLRQLWVRLSPSPSKKHWRGLVRSLGDSDNMRGEQSFRN
jgi:hypothetical protein